MIKKIDVYPSEAGYNATAFAKLLTSKLYNSIKTEYGNIYTYDEEKGIIWANGTAGISVYPQNSNCFQMRGYEKLDSSATSYGQYTLDWQYNDQTEWIPAHSNNYKHSIYFDVSNTHLAFIPISEYKYGSVSPSFCIIVAEDENGEWSVLLNNTTGSTWRYSSIVIGYKDKDWQDIYRASNTSKPECKTQLIQMANPYTGAMIKDVYAVNYLPTDATNLNFCLAENPNQYYRLCGNKKANYLRWCFKIDTTE